MCLQTLQTVIITWFVLAGLAGLVVGTQNSHTCISVVINSTLPVAQG